MFQSSLPVAHESRSLLCLLATVVRNLLTQMSERENGWSTKGAQLNEEDRGSMNQHVFCRCSPYVYFRLCKEILVCPALLPRRSHSLSNTSDDPNPGLIRCPVASSAISMWIMCIPDEKYGEYAVDTGGPVSNQRFPCQCKHPFESYLFNATMHVYKW